MAALPTARIPADAVKRLFTYTTWVAASYLMLMSVLGTFYWLLGMNASFNPARIYSDVIQYHREAYGALALQFIFSIGQYGCRLFAIDSKRIDWRYAIGYLIFLGASVVCNIASYAEPLLLLLPWYSVYPLIIAGDVAPELLLIKHGNEAT